ncbi:Hypothetical Protein SLY_0627 [Strawberry lethal yellows phytoplasma (CPA) str. NZSb11]|uniref:Antitoxin SocA-like Panacea domain-containing protein n=2 Tax=Phytoplasma australiense TaxID=59748 RepID=R4S1A7_PHYAS|nr:Hypothetical Protein SLY_0627 [Strawberry lethal yellows phytoplasma (CPA) str. NZSb11]
MGDITKINATQKQILDFMILLYGDALPNDLSSQTHMEHPWIKSYYKDYDSGWSKKIIKNKDILEYFSENNKNIGA